MRFIRIRHGGLDYFAELVDSETARLYTAAPYLGGQPTDRLVPMKPEKWLAAAQPSKIVCVGRNYAAHAKERGVDVPTEPLLFFKPPSSLLAHGGVVELPADSSHVEFEGEIAIVIGERLSRASRETCAAGIFGVTCANDVSARDLQKKDVQFTRAKGFDTFCPVGPWVETEGFDLENLDIQTSLNGTIKQSGNSSEMVFGILDLLVYISNAMTLEPGDLILTGTPAGVAPIAEGDVIEVAIPSLHIRLKHAVKNRSLQV